jgi:hypothetical protein
MAAWREGVIVVARTSSTVAISLSDWSWTGRSLIPSRCGLLSSRTAERITGRKMSALPARI